MSWLRRLLGGDTAEKPRYPCLDEGPHWHVTNAKGFELFFQHLADLMPRGSILYLEDPQSSEVREHLEPLKVEPEFEVQAGTLWPKPRKYHVPVTDENLSVLARLAQSHAEPEIAMHMVVYSGSTVLLEWYDAGDDPMAISKDIPKDRVRTFCENLGMECRDSLQD